MFRHLLAGAAAGAAGTTALNAVTYADMAWRARPASRTPTATVDRLSDVSAVDVPGQGEDRENRAAALGALTGIVTGVVVGAAYGALRATRAQPAFPVSVAVTTLGAMLGSNGPMTVLGVTDPRSWAAADWASDVVPHLAYGVVTAAAYEACRGR